MNKKLLIAGLCTAFFSIAASAQEGPGYDWEMIPVVGRHTGVTVSEMGEVKGGKFTAPNGKIFKNGATVKAARLMIKAQPSMAEVKEVIGHSTREMKRQRPESELSNMIIDVTMAFMEKETGRKVDMGIYNFGGIRVNMPEGDILKDDIVSMLPFTNYPTYIVLKGSEIRYWLEEMARRGSMQALGGANVVIKDRELVEAAIQGEPIDDEKEYGLVTIDFLLNGGDGMELGRNAIETITGSCLTRDILEEYIKGLTAEGKSVEYKIDGRVKVL